MKKFYFFMIALFAAIAANAETLVCSVYDYDTDTQESTDTGVRVDVDATIDGNVISFTKFLGSSLKFTATCYINGDVDCSASGDKRGTYTLGDLGTYKSMYFYGNNDFIYTVSESGEKALDGVFYFGTSYEALYRLVIALPADFEAVDKYPGMAECTLPITYEDGTTAEAVGHYKEGVVVVTTVVGAEITYNVYSNGAVTSSMSTGYEYYDFTYGDVDNYAIYFNGNSYCKYDTKTKVLSDYVYLYPYNGNIHYYIQLPDDFVAAEPEASEDVDAPEGTLATLVYDENTGSYGDNLYLAGTIDGNAVTFENFFGLGSTFVFTCHEDGSIDLTKDGVLQTGTYCLLKGTEKLDFGTYQFDKFYIYLAQLEYSVDVKGKYIWIRGYGYVGSTYSLYDLYISLPSDFDPASSSVANIAVAENGAAEYFNLQGVRVANPSNGIYIVRQGNKVSKVLVK